MAYVIFRRIEIEREKLLSADCKSPSPTPIESYFYIDRRIGIKSSMDWVLHASTVGDWNILEGVGYGNTECMLDFCTHAW